MTNKINPPSGSESGSSSTLQDQTNLELACTDQQVPDSFQPTDAHSPGQAVITLGIFSTTGDLTERTITPAERCISKPCQSILENIAFGVLVSAFAGGMVVLLYLSYIHKDTEFSPSPSPFPPPPPSF